MMSLHNIYKFPLLCHLPVVLKHPVWYILVIFNYFLTNFGYVKK